MKHNHLVHMVLGGAAVLVVLLALGVPVASALPYALVLACPLMMVGMMVGMRGGSHGAGCDHDHDDRAETVEAERHRSAHGH